MTVSSLIKLLVCLISLSTSCTAVYSQKKWEQNSNRFLNEKYSKLRSHNRLRFLEHGLQKKFEPRNSGANSSIRVTEAWVKHYGSGQAPSDDVVVGIVVDNNGNVYITGYTSTLPFGYDYLTIKYDSIGTVLWERQYNGPDNADDFAVAIGLDGNRNVYVTGRSAAESSTDYATVKYSSDGDELWTTLYRSSENSLNIPLAMHVEESGQLFITGWSREINSKNVYATVKYNVDGEELWVAKSGDRGGMPIDITVDDIGNVVIIGSSQGVGSQDDFTTIKYNSLGEEQWVAHYNGPGNHTDRPAGVVIDRAGSVFVTGISLADTTRDYATIKYNSNGIEQWVVRYSGDGHHNNNRPTAIALDSLGNIYVTGESDRDFATIRYNSQGIMQWIVRYDGGGWNWKWDRPTSLSLDIRGSIYVSGWTDGFSTNFDYITIKYDTNGVQQWLARYAVNSHGRSNANNFIDDSGYIYLAVSSWTSETAFDYGTVKYDSDGTEKWRVNYDGEGSSFDEAIGVFLEDSGNIKVIGKTGRQSTGYGTVKYSPNGTLLNAATFSGPNYGVDDIVNPTTMDNQGNIYVAGQLYNDDTGNFVVTKYDAFGNELWSAKPDNIFGIPRDVVVDEGGHIYVAGYYRGPSGDYDMITAKYDENGAELWLNTYNDQERGGNDVARVLAVDQKGSVYIVGSSNGSSDINDNDSEDYTILKYNGNGGLVWVRNYNGPDNFQDVATHVLVDDSGGIYVTGRSADLNYDLDYATVKYDEYGNEHWVARFDGSDRDWPQDFALDHSNNVYITGGWTVKYDSSGTLQWALEQGGEFMALDDRGNTYLTRVAPHDLKLTKIVTSRLNNKGEVQWTAQYVSNGYTYDFPIGIVIDQNNDVYVAGTSWGEKDWMVYTTIKYKQVEEEPIVPSDFNLAPNYPNPFNAGTIIEYLLPEDGMVTLKVFDLLGREVATFINENQMAGKYQFRWQPRNLASGIYFYRLQAGGNIKTRKLVLLQ